MAIDTRCMHSTTATPHVALCSLCPAACTFPPMPVSLTCPHMRAPLEEAGALAAPCLRAAGRGRPLKYCVPVHAGPSSTCAVPIFARFYSASAVRIIN